MCIYIYISVCVCNHIIYISIYKCTHNHANMYKHTYKDTYIHYIIIAITITITLTLQYTYIPVGLPTWRGHLFGLTASTCTVFPADARPAHGGHRTKWGSRDPPREQQLALPEMLLSFWIWNTSGCDMKGYYRKEVDGYELIVKDFYG